MGSIMIISLFMDSFLYGKHGVYAFGEFTFKTSCNETEVTFRLVQEDGSYIYEKSLTLSELTPKNKMNK